MFPVDEQTIKYFAERGIPESALNKEYADADAEYARVLEYDLSKIVPVVSKPHEVDNVCPVSKMVGTEIHQCLLGTCTNGRYDGVEYDVRDD